MKIEILIVIKNSISLIIKILIRTWIFRHTSTSSVAELNSSDADSISFLLKIFIRGNPCLAGKRKGG